MHRLTDGYDSVIMELSGNDRPTKALLLTPLKLLSFMMSECHLPLLVHARYTRLSHYFETVDRPMTFFNLAAATARARIISTRLVAHSHRLPVM